MMAPIQDVPDDLRDLYEVHDWRHASSILSSDFPSEFLEICNALRTFRFTEEQVKAPGGNESEIPKSFSRLLRPLGWKEQKLVAKHVVDDVTVQMDTHKIDYCKGRIALDLEWNSKDQTFDRDLFAFRTFWDYDKISVGILVTRSIELNGYFKSLGSYRDRGGTRRQYIAKYGASTTHLGKLLPRLEAGRSGGCPVLVFGITSRLLQKGNM